MQKNTKKKAFKGTLGSPEILFTPIFGLLKTQKYHNPMTIPFWRKVCGEEKRKKEITKIMDTSSPFNA
jgi:hypothetical protein